MDVSKSVERLLLRYPRVKVVETEEIIEEGF